MNINLRIDFRRTRATMIMRYVKERRRRLIRNARLTHNTLEPDKRFKVVLKVIMADDQNYGWPNGKFKKTLRKTLI